MRALQTWFGMPLLFFTLNPADVLHPLTFHHSVDGSSFLQSGLPLADDALLAVLRSHKLADIVAKDPVAATRAFHAHVLAFFAHLAGCTIDPAKLALDGVAAGDNEGIFGDCAAAFGSVEPQLRGSLHIHVHLHLYAFTHPQDIADRFASNFEKFKTGILAWVSSITFTSVEALPTFLGLEPSGDLSTLRTLPYTPWHQAALAYNLADYVRDATKVWLPQSSTPIAPAAQYSDPFGDTKRRRRR